MTRSFHSPLTDPFYDEPTAFVLVAHGPPVPSEEVERTEKDALEVRVLWDRTPLAMHHLDREGSIVLGDHQDSIARIPESALGASAFELARTTATGFLVRLPPGATARLGEGARAIVVDGPREWETSRGDVIAMEVGHFRIEIVHGGAGKAVPRAALLDRLRETATTHVSGAALLHTALFGIFAYYTPVLTGEDDASAAGRGEQITLMRAYLDASAEREHDRADVPNAATEPSGTSDPSGGSRAMGASGTMGKENAPARDARWGKAGPKDNTAPVLGRAGDLPAGFEMIGLVAQSTGDRSAPSTPWGPLDAVGADPVNALGNMWGSTIADAAGFGGLDLTGAGEGGGGTSQWVGLNLNDVGRSGHGLGPPGDGIGPGGYGKGGSCPGCQLRGHATSAPSIRPGTTTLTGHMPAEVIQRVVRDNFGRFRNCYEAGLRENPSLEGRVVTRFAID